MYAKWCNTPLKSRVVFSNTWFSVMETSELQWQWDTISEQNRIKIQGVPRRTGFSWQWKSRGKSEERRVKPPGERFEFCTTSTQRQEVDRSNFHVVCVARWIPTMNLFILSSVRVAHEHFEIRGTIVLLWAAQNVNTACSCRFESRARRIALATSRYVLPCYFFPIERYSHLFFPSRLLSILPGVTRVKKSMATRR